VTEKESEPGGKGLRFSKWGEITVELERACMESVTESGNELTAEDTAEHLDGKEEGAARGDPACVIRSEATGGKYAVDMRMKLQPLIPAVKHAEEADLSSKMPWIAGDLKQGLSTGVKEQIIDQTFVL